MATTVGIDLGTTYSAVAAIDPKTGAPFIVPNREGKNITPSVIHFINGKPVFGSEAEDAHAAGVIGCAAGYKRSMGKPAPFFAVDGVNYTAQDLSALLLGHLKANAEEWLNNDITEAVITVPAYFFSPEREATIAAAQTADINVKKLIDEPSAAVMAYGITHWRENARLLVYDLGGGTFDITLTVMGRDGQLTTIATEGNQNLGGRDWDAQLADLLIEKVSKEIDDDVRRDSESLLIVRGLCEGIKQQLSAVQRVEKHIMLPGRGRITIDVTRQEFETVTADLIERTGSLCLAVLDAAGIKKSDVTDILLVGGSTRMPQVSSYITDKLGKKPIAHVHPDEAVALGAAIQTTKSDAAYVRLSVSMKNGVKRASAATVNTASMPVKPAKKLQDIASIKVNEIVAHALGVIAVSPDGKSYINDVIIPAHHPIPVKAAKSFNFFTSSRGDNELEIYVLQGDKAPLECVIPCKYVVSGIRHLPEKKGKTLMRVQYSYDQNGIIRVYARQENDNHDLPIRAEPLPDDMSKYGLPISAEETPRPEPLSVMMAIDVSYSMDGDPLIKAKDALCAFVDQMDMDYTDVGAIAVSNSALLVQPLSGKAGKVKAAIGGIKVAITGGSNSGHPFDLILSEMRWVKGRKLAIVLADGMWSCQESAIAAAQKCNKYGIETAAVGFGSANWDFLRAISSSEANSFLVNQNELTQTFGKIAQSLGDSGPRKKRGDGQSSDTQTW